MQITISQYQTINQIVKSNKDDLDKEIALLEQRLKIADNKLENKIENLSISLIDLIDSFYLSQSKFKKLYKFYDFKFYINDELFDFDRNKILNYFSDSLSKKNVYLEIYLIYNFSSFFEWEDNDVNYSVNLEIEFKQNNYSITINQEVILEKEQLQPIDKNDISIIISKLNIIHKEFIEQKIAEKENK